MAFEYFNVEDEIVAQLNQYSSLFSAVAMPDSDDDWDDAIPKPRVTVAFRESKSLGLRATDLTNYEEELTIDCLIQSRTQRGDGGTYHICKLLKEALNGFEVTNGNQLYFSTFQKHDDYRDVKNKIWNWVLTFTMKKMQVQTIPTTNVIGANLQEVDFNDVVQLP